MPKAYIAVVRIKPPFGNNSGKFYRETSAQVTRRSPANETSGALRQMGIKSRIVRIFSHQNQIIYKRYIFSVKTTHRFTHFPAADTVKVENTKRESLWS